MGRVGAVFKAAFAVILLAYPLLIYFGLNYLDIRVLALLLIVLAIARVVGILSAAPSAPMRTQMIFAAFALIVVAITSFLLESIDALRLYPVFVSGLLLVLFSVSLFYPPTIIEKLARLSEPDLSPEGVVYTRKVTMVWCAFFVLNGAVALYTALESSFEVWVFYNGFLSYILMGGLFSIEYVVRQWVKRRRVMAP